jgi:hypothetical protein
MQSGTIKYSVRHSSSAYLNAAGFGLVLQT